MTWPVSCSGLWNPHMSRCGSASATEAGFCRYLVSLAPLGDGCLMGAGGGDDELDDRIQGHRGGVDHQVVQRRVGRVAPVQAANVGVAGLVGRAQALPRLLRTDALG